MSGPVIIAHRTVVAALRAERANKLNFRLTHYPQWRLIDLGQRPPLSFETSTRSRERRSEGAGNDQLYVFLGAAESRSARGAPLGRARDRRSAGRPGQARS